jgi:hypothetical protein
MRLVVGPLPASVYWRRRAMVLGGVVLAVFMIVYSCEVAGMTSNAGNGSGATPSTGQGQGVSSEPSVPPSRAPAAPAGAASQNPSPTAAVVDANLCTDSELLVTAVTAKTTVQRGSEMHFKLLIKNTSSRSCSRDVGPDQQELYIKLGTYVVFSSDHCDGPTGSEVRTFPSQHERSVEIVWNGKSSVSCSTTQKRTPNGPEPDAGEYQLLGRVGTDLSEPVTLKLT